MRKRIGIEGARDASLGLVVVVAVCLAPDARGQACPSGLAGARGYAVSDWAADVAIGDFNGDGAPDLAASTPAIAILLNAGDGTFLPPRDVGAPALDWYRAIVSADLDGDGNVDLALASEDRTIHILLGNGDVTFWQRAPLPLAAVASDLAVADLDGDGILDLATGNGDPTVSVLLGYGGGRFAPELRFPAGVEAGALAIGDVTGDGAKDIVVCGYSGVGLLRNRGNGRFLAPWVYPVASPVYSVVLEPFNGDGYADAALGTYYQGVVVLLGSASGLGPPSTVSTQYASSVTAADLDGNGTMDILAGGSVLEVLSGDGTGAFQQVGAYGTWSSSNLAAVDLDSDGLRDVVGISPWVFASGITPIAAFRGIGGGRLLAAPYYDTPGWGENVAVVADFDVDGTPDLALAGQSTYQSIELIIALNDGQGAYTRLVYYGVYRGNSLVTGDWNLDGKPDLAIGCTSYGACYAGSRVLIGNGDGTFREAAGAPSMIGGLGAGDLNGDGAADLVSGYFTSLYASISNGDGTFQLPVLTTVSDWITHIIAVRDLDGGGLGDLVAASDYGQFYTFRGRGDGTFDPPVAYPGFAYEGRLAVADLNADGALDVAVSSVQRDSVAIFLGAGTGALVSTGVVPAITNPLGVAAGDVDGDGRVDLVINSGLALASIARGAGDGTFSVVGTYDAFADVHFVDDVDGDEVNDVVLVGDGRIHVLRSLEVQILPDSLPQGTVGVPYSLGLRGAGGAAPYAFAVGSGSLPPGLVLAASGLLSGTPTAAGTYGFEVALADAQGCPSRRAYRLTVAGGSGVVDEILAGEGLGVPNPNRVKVYGGGGTATSTDFFAYGAGKWGVNVAAGAIDGAGVGRILTGPGPGVVYGPHVRGFERRGVAMLGVSFYAYGTLRYGVNPAAGDVDGGARDEIVTGAGPGAAFGPHVRGFAYDGSRVAPVKGLSYFAYGMPRYGVNVAAGDLDGDGFDEIVTGPGPDAAFPAQVRGWDFDGTAVAAIGAIDFLAFATPGFGVNVAAGELDGDPYAEMACASGPGSGPSYPPRFVGFDYDGASVAALPGFDVTAGATSYGGRVGVGDVTGDGRGDLLAGLGRDPAADSTVRPYIYAGSGLAPLYSFQAFPSAAYGVNVTGASLGP